MVHAAIPQVVWNAYPELAQAASTTPLGSGGGYSGAQLWRVHGPQELVLRRWPKGQPDAGRLRKIHDLLGHVAERGVTFAPTPLPTHTGATFVEAQGFLWELAPWLPGQPVEQTPACVAEIREALTALAQFHRAAADFPTFPMRIALSPGMAERRLRLERLAREGFGRLAAAIRPEVWAEGATPAREILELGAFRLQNTWAAVREGERLAGPIQMGLRDVWKDHVLFAAGKVRGLIDFGAVRPESPAADIARLLGSLAEDSTERWEAGLDAYTQIRPLADAERRLIPIFDQTTTLLGGIAWIEWIYLEGRQFENIPAIDQRLRKFVQRLRATASRQE